MQDNAKLTGVGALAQAKTVVNVAPAQPVESAKGPSMQRLAKVPDSGPSRFDRCQRFFEEDPSGAVRKALDAETQASKPTVAAFVGTTGAVGTAVLAGAGLIGPFGWLVAGGLLLVGMTGLGSYLKAKKPLKKAVADVVKAWPYADAAPTPRQVEQYLFYRNGGYDVAWDVVALTP